MSKHIPGPWKCVSQTDHKTAIVSSGGEVDFLIAFTYPERYGTPNAHLIAAAPEMLNALIETLDFIEQFGKEATDSKFAFNVEQLIKKAKGEV